MGSQLVGRPSVVRDPIPIDSFAGPVRTASARNRQPASTTHDADSDERDSGIGFVRGTLLMIGLEIVVALSLYGLWHLWLLVR